MKIWIIYCVNILQYINKNIYMMNTICNVLTYNNICNFKFNNAFYNIWMYVIINGTVCINRFNIYVQYMYTIMRKILHTHTHTHTHTHAMTLTINVFSKHCPLYYHIISYKKYVIMQKWDKSWVLNWLHCYNSICINIYPYMIHA